MSRFLYRLGAVCVRRRYVVLLMWTLAFASVVAGVLAFGMRTNNDIRLPGTGAQHASDLLRREFPPQQNGLSPIVFRAARGKLTDPAQKRAVEASVAAMKRTASVSAVISPFSPAGKSFLSADGKTAVAQVLLDVNGGQLTRAVASRVFSAAEPARQAGIQVEAGGAVGLRLSETKSRRSEAIGLISAVIILAFTFGCLAAAGMPVVTAIVGLITGLGLVGLLGHFVAIPDVAPTLATMIGLGVGIDYALFIVFRYRDELHGGATVQDAIARTMATSGSAVVFAGGTVIIALLSLLVARVPILGAMGYAAAIAVVVAVLTAVTMLPAVLAVLGPRIDALRLPGRRRPHQTAGRDNVWARWAGLVTRHPWIALVASLLVLVPLMLPVLTLTLGQEDVGVTPASTTQRRAFDLISAGFGPGANGPLVVAAEFRPAATPSAAYASKIAEAGRLKKSLDAGKKRLTRRARALKTQGAALKTQQAALMAQGAALQSRKDSLQAQGAMLQRQQSALLASKNKLLAQQAKLTAEGEALAAKGQALAAQIVQVKQQLATATDPLVIAELQAQLAGLVAQAQQVQAQSAALQQQGAALAAQGKRLQAQGDALLAKGNALKTQGAALQAQAAKLAAQGAALKKQGAALQAQAASLKKAERRLKGQGKRALALKDELTKLLTKAAGQPRATDPRIVRLQDAFAATAGVRSVAPPRVNKSGTAAVFALTPTHRPADPVTAALVKRLRATVIPDATRGQGVSAYVGGVTAAYDDLAALIAKRLPLVIGTVLALSFVILLLAFRSVLVPLKAIICNLLAVGAAFGVLTVLFQWGWGLRFVGLANPYGTVPIASYVPLIMFAVLFGMSTDYEVFLISQIFQAHAAGQGSHEAVRTGVGTSARVITAAALIMITVFASFILNGDPVIKEFGVGLSIAILLDATIVRMVIVPATMVLLGEWNWYLPRWLEWLPRMDLPEEDPTAPTTAQVIAAASPAGD
ncbi:MAG TPA: MMPL family transporter [Thermoleophilia bacterium]|nr:MMPL family transporter [Thermoleophilia bacterium]